MNSEITEAWEWCQAAAERYGTYVSSMLDGINNEIASVQERLNALNTSSGSSSFSSVGVGFSGSSDSTANNVVVGNSVKYQDTPSGDEMIRAIVSEMKQNALAWHSASDSRKGYLNDRNLELGDMLKQYGVNAYKNNQTGVWYVGSEPLFQKYHGGGVVGGGSLKDNEQLSILEDEEWVLSKRMVQNLREQITRIAQLGEILTPDAGTGQSLLQGLAPSASSSVQNITNSRPVTITFGDTNITGMPESAAKQHVKVNREMLNEIARMLRLKL